MIVKVIKMLSAPKISGILCTSQSVMIWRLSSSEDNEKEKKSVSASIEERIHLLRTLPDTWKKMNAKQKQSVVRELVQKVEINDGKINIYLYKNKYNDLSFISRDVI